MKPNQISFASSFGLSNANLAAIKKQEKAGLPAVDHPSPFGFGASAFAFRNQGVQALFQRKPANV